MKLKYYREDDILVITLSQEAYDHAEMEGNFVVHFTKNKRPVRVEILNAHKFLEAENKALPNDIKKAVFA